MRNRILIACLVGGLVLVAVGLIVGPPAASIEAAYFDRANGVPAYAGVFAVSPSGLLDPAGGRFWLCAGVLLLLVPTGVIVWRGLRRRPDAALSD